LFKKCVKVPGLEGAEDAEMNHKTGLVFISVQPSRRAFLGGSNVTSGGIYTLDLERAINPKPIKLKFENFDDSNGKFIPHGIGLHVTAEDKQYLFVVNHGQHTEKIEIFVYTGNSLRHVETVKSPLLLSVNDVYPVSPTSFYATNDHSFSQTQHRFLTLLCDTLKLRVGSIIYHGRDGAGIIHESFINENMSFANGISGRGKYVYVAETLSGTLHIFERVGPRGELELRDSIRTHVKVDNIAFDEDGEHLLVAAHPKELNFLLHAMNEERRSPS